MLGLAPLAPLVPASLVAVLSARWRGRSSTSTTRAWRSSGAIDSGLAALALPDVGAADYLELVGPAVGVLLIGFAEGLGAAKTYAARAGYEVDPNRELLGLGAANLGAGLSRRAWS